jgi:regulator of protease activity HflC (stomatin/prohibitin superfamily)
MTQNQAHSEREFAPLSGWPVLFGCLAIVAAVIVFAKSTNGLSAGIGVPLIALIAPGFFIVGPNTSRVLVLFGKYRGSVRTQGLWYTNPFTMKYRVSLRAHNFNTEKLKVNDLLGNPIEIAAVIVWRVRDSARAKFDVENFEQFIAVQSESALRQIASKHPYDDGQAHDVATSLRGSAEIVASELVEMLQQRLEQAGIEVIEARLSHLAYAPEIASAMLQRQQATAVIAARAKIVEGAVGMVEMALEHLDRGGKVQLDAERRATLVGNLLVVLCSHENPTPVLNTGSLYN